MAKVDIRSVREKCSVMNDAWLEGAKAVEFNGITQAAFLADIDAAAVDGEVGDLEAEFKMKREVRDEMDKAGGLELLMPAEIGRAHV